MIEPEFKPLVSIIIPVYNGSNYLNEAIHSALNQTYENIEVLVINDGSDDTGATEKIALSYGEKIRYFSKENGGVATALNLGIKKMHGEYFSWLSHDDLYCQNKISAQIKKLKLQIDKQKIVYSDCVIFEDDSDEILPIIAGEPINGKIRYHLTIKSSIHGCSFLIPRNAFNVVGVFSEKLRLTQDYDMWFRLGTQYEFVYLPDALVRSRHHKSQDSSRYKHALLRECDNLRVGFIKDLSVAEVKSYSKSLILSYLYLYSVMSKCGYMASANLALEYYNNAGSKNLLAKISRLALLCVVNLDLRYRIKYKMKRIIKILIK